MIANIDKLSVLADKLRANGKTSEALELSKLITKTSAEWDTLSPDKKNEFMERQDWHRDPIGYINKEPVKPADPTSGVPVKEVIEQTEESKDAAIASATEEFNKFLDLLKEKGITPEAFFDTLKSSGGLILHTDPETNKFVTKKEEPESDKSSVLGSLLNMADRLDKIGAHKEADLLDKFIQKHSTVYIKTAAKETKTNDKYDSKKHHSIQIQESSKKEKESNGTKGNGNSTLSTRYCPQHIGVMVSRIGELTYQCPLDGQVYNYEVGWTDAEGVGHPGGSVAAQTPDSTGYDTPHRLFDSRSEVQKRN